MIHLLRLLPGLFLIAATTVPAVAQLSFTTVIDLALRNSPKVKMAQADVDKARAALDETRHAYIPAVVAGLGEGKSYGPPLGQPAIFSVTSQSLLFSYSQRDYIRAAQAGFNAANLALEETRQAVEEDAALVYFSLNDAQQRKTALAEESGFAEKLMREG